MSLKRLSIAEMVKHTADLLEEGSEGRRALGAVPELEVLVPQIREAYEGLLAAQPPNESEIAALTDELGELDALHDDLIRGLALRLEAEILGATGDAEDRLAAARAALFPKGLTVVMLSYTEQAGEADLRAARVDDEVRDTLRTLERWDGRTLLSLYEELQRVAHAIGDGERRREALVGDGTETAHAGKARNRWIRTINALETMLEMFEVDPQPIVGRIRDAAERAARPRPGADVTPEPEPSPGAPQPRT